MSELETLIENKIYHQDDLENRIHELEREIRIARQGQAQAETSTLASRSGEIGSPAVMTGITPTRTSSLANRTQPLVLQGRKSSSASTSGSTRASSTSGSVHTAEEYLSPPRTGAAGSGNERCELCEGPHDLDACPVFAGNLDAPPAETQISKPAVATDERYRHPDIDLRGQSKRELRCADCDVSSGKPSSCLEKQRLMRPCRALVMRRRIVLWPMMFSRNFVACMSFRVFLPQPKKR